MTPLNVADDKSAQELAQQVHAALKEFEIRPLDSPEGPKASVAISEIRRGLKFPEEDNLRIATLVNIDGVVYWTDGPVPCTDAGRRRRAGLTTLFSGQPITTVKFEALGVNEVAQKLDEMDARFTPKGPATLRRIENGQIIDGPVAPVERGRILLFIHGTFSNNDNLIQELTRQNPDGPQFLADAGQKRNYDQVLAFDHYTVSRSPMLNALELARLLASSSADIDIICHSRGGLVTRWFCEVMDRVAGRKRRAVLVGSPIGGTSLAAPNRLRSALNLFTNIGSAIGEGVSLIPFLSAAGAIMKLGFSVASAATKTPLIDAGVAMIPGLAAQSRILNNYELEALKTLPKEPPRYFAVTSDFRPVDPGWKFWRVFCDWTQAAAAAEDQIFKCANDLVVDTAAMTQTVNPAATLTFDESAHVYHTIYFRQPRTVKFMRESFGIETAAAAGR